MIFEINAFPIDPYTYYPIIFVCRYQWPPDSGCGGSEWTLVTADLR